MTAVADRDNKAVTVAELDSRVSHIGETVYLISLYSDLRPEPIDEPKHWVSIEENGVRVFSQWFIAFDRARDVYEHPFAFRNVWENTAERTLALADAE